MQIVSKAYKEAISKPMRNRGYIKVSIGVINSDAQKSISAEDSRNDFAYFADASAPLNGIIPTKIYATPETNFSKVDGSMYFVPDKANNVTYYNNGIVTNDIMGSVYIKFETEGSFDIKGFVINFGENYPELFEISNDNVTYRYLNEQSIFTTEDVFDGTTFIKITPLRMKEKYNRLRIYNFTCGIANIFTNNEIISYTQKDYVSPITDSVPSQDTTVIVDNQNLYYSPDNAESALAYMEVGQEIKVSFGYDVVGNGKASDIEWLPEVTTYLKQWSATDVQAKFVGTDRFDYLTDKYYGGHYYADGISLYDLAIDVLNNAGIEDSKEYFVDNYLKKVIVKNPIPVVTHAEALQIIANAGRCALSVDRQKRIHIQSSFVPTMEVSTNGITDYSNIANLLVTQEKTAYAITSKDFSIVDGSLLFMPADKNYVTTNGYVSNMVSDADGNFVVNPIISISMESSFEVYGLTLNFRNTHPSEIKIHAYDDLNNLVEEKTYFVDDLTFITNDYFKLFNRMDIEITKGYPLSRVVLNNILVNNVTDYELSLKTDLTGNYTATRQDKIKSINIERTIYSESNGESVDLKNEEMTLVPGETEYIIYFTKPSYDYFVSITDKYGNEQSNVTCEIVNSNNYYATIKFTNTAAEDSVIKYTIHGKEYIADYQWYVQKHNDNGIVKEWQNPLISDISHAIDLEDWLATYFLGDVSYQIPWCGDPRTDANDLYYLETKSAGKQLIRGYENTIKFDGTWSSTIKARRAVLDWQ